MAKAKRARAKSEDRGYTPDMRGMQTIQPIDRVQTNLSKTGVIRPKPWTPDDVLILRKEEPKKNKK